MPISSCSLSKSKFNWKSFSSESEENIYRTNQEIELYHDEALEIEAYQALSVCILFV